MFDDILVLFQNFLTNRRVTKRCGNRYSITLRHNFTRNFPQKLRRA